MKRSLVILSLLLLSHTSHAEPPHFQPCGSAFNIDVPRLLNTNYNPEIIEVDLGFRIKMGEHFVYQNDLTWPNPNFKGNVFLNSRSKVKQRVGGNQKPFETAVDTHFLIKQSDSGVMIQEYATSKELPNNGFQVIPTKLKGSGGISRSKIAKLTFDSKIIDFQTIQFTRKTVERSLDVVVQNVRYVTEPMFVVLTENYLHVLILNPKNQSLEPIEIFKTPLAHPLSEAKMKLAVRVETLRTDSIASSDSPVISKDRIEIAIFVPGQPRESIASGEKPVQPEDDKSTPWFPTFSFLIPEVL